MFGKLVSALIGLLLLVPAQAQVRVEEVTYRDGDTVLRGVLAYDPARKARAPGLLVVHEWWGITRHVRDSVRELAERGYTALAVDMFGEGRTADNPGDAGKLAGSVRGNPAVLQSRFNAARQFLVSQASVDAARIGALGYCFGGAVVLEMARAGADLAGVVSFHGSLGTKEPAAPGKVRARVLVLNGADDPLVSADSIAAFRKEMAEAKVNYRFVDYPGAVHAFTNPEATALGQKFMLPLAYHAEVDRQSKDEMHKFFGALFGGGK